MLFIDRQRAKARTNFLLELGRRNRDVRTSESRAPLLRPNQIQLLLHQANLDIRPMILVASCLMSAALIAGLSISLLSAWFLPLYFVLGAALPLTWIEGRIRSRALEFATDYPSVLLAAASSVKTGLTPYQAMERATRLLAKDSLVRKEVEKLLKDLRSGKAREQAVKEFGSSIRQPDLELFRSAFLLVLENGGRFSPTLSRLAAVSNNRAILIRSGTVSTSSMRMTANILVVIAPILVLIVAWRTDNYWTVFFSNPVANTIASSGILLITLCYALLRHMSNFRP